MTEETTIEHKFADEIALADLRPFLPVFQRQTLRDNCEHSEERDYFRQLVRKMADRVRTMPATRGQEDVEDPIVYLHFFRGGMDFHITEKDCEPEQLQAFGLANLGYGAELGYINITELVENGVELDLYFEPVALSTIRDL